VLCPATKAVYGRPFFLEAYIMSAAFQYDTFVTRNSGYIDHATQAKIRSSRLLFAGCGLGSSTVICAARSGFQHFVLIDGDTIDAHNLNRQFFDF
jgi:molybdopterin-synthase adenylyltransferase